MPLGQQYLDRVKNIILGLYVPSSSSFLTMKEIFYIAEVDENSSAEIIALAVLKEMGLISASASRRMSELGGPAGNSPSLMWLSETSF